MTLIRVRDEDWPKRIDWYTAPAVPPKVLSGEVSEGTIVSGPHGQEVYIRPGEKYPAQRTKTPLPMAEHGRASTPGS